MTQLITRRERRLKSSLLGVSGDTVVIYVKEREGYTAFLKINGKEERIYFPFDGHYFQEKEAYGRPGDHAHAVHAIMKVAEKIYRDYQLKGDERFDSSKEFISKRSMHYMNEAAEYGDDRLTTLGDASLAASFDLDAYHEGLRDR